jgi:hypothetical protein
MQTPTYASSICTDSSFVSDFESPQISSDSTWHWPPAAAAFVFQTLQSILQKTLRPLVDKATADPNRVRNMGERHTIGHE